MKRRKFLTLIGSFGAIAFVNPSGLLVDLEVIRCAKKLGDMLERNFEGEMKMFNAMCRVGVSFSVEQQAQIQEMAGAGKTVEAQRLILAHLGTWHK